MQSDPSAVSRYLSGQRILSADPAEGGQVWQFAIEGGGTLSVECPWRIIADGAIAFAATDLDQVFGHGAGADGRGACERLLKHRRITQSDISIGTGDVVLLLDDGTRLEIWCNSSGYECWQLNTADGVVFVAAGRNGVIAAPTAAIWKG